MGLLTEVSGSAKGSLEQVKLGKTGVCGVGCQRAQFKFPMPLFSETPLPSLLSFHSSPQAGSKFPRTQPVEAAVPQRRKGTPSSGPLFPSIPCPGQCCLTGISRGHAAATSCSLAGVGRDSIWKCPQPDPSPSQLLGGGVGSHPGGDTRLRPASGPRQHATWLPDGESRGEAGGSYLQS